MPTGTHQPQRLRGVDRLPPLIALAGSLLLGCTSGDTTANKESKPSAGSRSRVNAVEAKKAPKLDPNDFCTQLPDPSAAKTLTWPALTADAPASSKTKRWINVWATWCAPCVEEMPRITGWKETIGRRVEYDMMFVSADGDPPAVAAFVEQRPAIEGTLELAEAEGLAPWLASLGIDDARLPVHLFVDGDDRLRCVRESGIGDDDEEAVAQLLESI